MRCRRLIERLADLRSRLVRYRVSPSPLGPILIAGHRARRVAGQYLGRGGVAGSRLFTRRRAWRPEEAAPISDHFHRELRDFIAGRRALRWTGRSTSARRAAISSAR
mgnify:CR=1 FL=1